MAVTVPPKVAAICHCQLNLLEMPGGERRKIQPADVDAVTTEKVTATEEFAPATTSVFARAGPGPKG